MIYDFYMSRDSDYEDVRATAHLLAFELDEPVTVHAHLHRSPCNRDCFTYGQEPPWQDANQLRFEGVA